MQYTHIFFRIMQIKYGTQLTLTLTWAISLLLRKLKAKTKNDRLRLKACSTWIIKYLPIFSIGTQKSIVFKFY